MSIQEVVIDTLADKISLLPGIGSKKAKSLAYFLINQDDSYLKSFGDILITLKSRIKLCDKCYCFTDKETCFICLDDSRDKSKICIVSNSKEIETIEKTKSFNGYYHVTHGYVDIFKKTENLKIKEFIIRLQNDVNIKEIIFAFDNSPDAKASIEYIKDLIPPNEYLLTKLATGISIGSNIDSSDYGSIKESLKGRKEL